MIINTNPHSVITVGSKSSQEDLSASGTANNNSTVSAPVKPEEVKSIKLTSKVKKSINKTQEETSNVSSNKETSIESGSLKTTTPEVNTVINNTAKKSEPVQHTSMTGEVSSTSLQQDLLSRGYSTVWNDAIKAVGNDTLQVVAVAPGEHLSFGQPMKLSNGNKVVYLGSNGNGTAIVTNNPTQFNSELKAIIANQGNSNTAMSREALELLTFSQGLSPNKLGIVDNGPGFYHGWTLETDVPFTNGEPAFCLQPWYRNPEGINYNPGGSFSQITQNKLYYIATYNGTGKVSINGMSWWESYMAKQVAIWCLSGEQGSLGDQYGFTINQLSANTSYGTAILNGAKELLADANKYAKYSGPAINVTQSTGTNISGNMEVSGLIKYDSNLGKNVHVELINPPAGARIVDLYQYDGGYGQFKVEVPDNYKGTIRYKVVGSTPQRHTVIYAPSVNNKYQHMLGFSETPIYASSEGAVNCSPLQGSIVTQLFNHGHKLGENNYMNQQAGTAVTSREVESPARIPDGYHIGRVVIIVGGKDIATLTSASEINSIASGHVPADIRNIIGNQCIYVVYDIEKNAPKVAYADVSVWNNTTNKQVEGSYYQEQGAPNTIIQNTKMKVAVPEGYHIQGVKVNGKNFANVGEMQTDNSRVNYGGDNSTTHIVYYIVKNSPRGGIVSQAFLGDHNIGQSESSGILAGTNTTYGETTIPEMTIDGKKYKAGVVPEGYHATSATIMIGSKTIDTITNSGDILKLMYGTIPPSIGKIVGNQTIYVMYHIEKNAPKVGKEVVSVYNETTKSYETSLGYTTSGDAGSSIAKTSIVCPSGYHIVKTTVNNTLADTDKLLGNKDGLTYAPNGTTTIVYTIVKNAPKMGKEVVSVYNETTKSYETSLGYNTSGNAGSSIAKTGIVCPSGYHIVKTTVNGNAGNTDNLLGNKAGLTYVANGTTTIVYTIVKDAAKIGTFNINVYDADGQSNIDNSVLIPKMSYSKTGNEGDPIGKEGIALPKGYKIIKLVIHNGSKVTTLNMKDENLLNQVVSTYQATGAANPFAPKENAAGDIASVSGNGKNTSTGNDGSFLELLSKATGIPTADFINGNITLDYYIKRVHPVKLTVPYTTSVVGVNDLTHKVIFGPNMINKSKANTSFTDVEPSELTTGKYSDYYIVKIELVNLKTGKVSPLTLSDLPKVQPNNNQEIVYYISKKNPITISVVGTNGKVYEVPTTTDGTPTSPYTPNYKIPEGQHIVKVTVDGKIVPIDQLPKNYSHKHVIVITVAPNLKPQPKYTNSIVTVNTNGKELDTPVVKTGIAGTPDKETPYVPKGQHIVKVTCNGKVIPISEIPQVIGNSNNKIIVTVAPNPNKITISVVGTNGKVYEVPTTTEGAIGSPYTPKYKIPAGQHIVKITVDGKVVSSVKDIPDNYDHNHDIVITVAPIVHKITISVIGTDGHVYQKPITTDGVPTAPYTPKYKIPAENHIVKVTVDGKEVPLKDIPTNYNHDHIIVITVAPIVHKITISVVGSNGHIYEKPTTTEGKPGQPYTPKYKIPAHNKIIKVTVDGKEVPLKDLPKNYNENHNIVITVAPNPGNADVKVVTANGTVISNKTYNGTNGQGFNGTPSIPKGYHIVKITQNGKVVTNPDDILTNPTDKIVYTIAKNPSKITIKVMIGNKVIWTKPFDGEPGTTPKGEQPPIPKGYHIQEITQNGKVTTMPNGEINDNPNNTIIYHLVKDAEPTIINHTIIKNNKTVIDNQVITNHVVDEQPAPTPQAPVIEQPAPAPQAPVQQVTKLADTGTNQTNDLAGELGLLAAVAGMSIVAILKRKR